MDSPPQVMLQFPIGLRADVRVGDCKQLLYLLSPTDSGGCQTYRLIVCLPVVIFWYERKVK